MVCFQHGRPFWCRSASQDRILTAGAASLGTAQALVARSVGDDFLKEGRRKAGAAECLSLLVVRRCQEVHQVPCGIPVSSFLERNVEIGRVTQHVKERPKRKSFGTVCLESKIYPQPIDACFLHRRRCFA